jgi:hypothetical protein
MELYVNTADAKLVEQQLEEFVKRTRTHDDSLFVNPFPIAMHLIREHVPFAQMLPSI